MYNGYVESEEKVLARWERTKAKSYACEVFLSSQMTEEEAAALDRALDMILDDPAHIVVASRFVLLALANEQVTR